MDMVEEKVKTSPQDFFLNLLSIVSLYVSATSFGALLFQYINHFFPNPLRFYYGGENNAIQFAVAALVVFFPVYVVSVRLLNKDKTARKTKFYKWLAYFTLFAATLVILGDVVAIVFQFFGGDLTTRFLLKALVILFIGGSVLWTYLRDARGAEVGEGVRYFSYFVMAFVVVAVLGSFLIAGTPADQRERAFDMERVEGLQNIQAQVIRFWQAKGRVPDELSELEEDISGFLPGVDPETGDNYGYRALEANSFEICATFSTASEEAYPAATKPFGVSENWAHGVGRVCFKRVIDPELYPVNEDFESLQRALNR